LLGLLGSGTFAADATLMESPDLHIIANRTQSQQQYARCALHEPVVKRSRAEFVRRAALCSASQP
jgi:hypothetical protein